MNQNLYSPKIRDKIQLLFILAIHFGIGSFFRVTGDPVFYEANDIHNALR